MGNDDIIALIVLVVIVLFIIAVVECLSDKPYKCARCGFETKSAEEAIGHEKHEVHKCTQG
jgi:hypothetical protein